jgi:hypothetical protein
LYGRPVLGLLGSVSSSAVWCPAERKWGTAFQKACSPVHSRSHCSFSMCHTPASHWSLPPPTASILCLSRLSSRVALAQLVPRRSSWAPGISGMLSSCGGKRPVSRVRGLSVNLRGAILEIPENWQTVALQGHDRQDGCVLSQQGPTWRAGSQLLASCTAHSHGATACGFFGLRHQGRRSIN